MYLKISRLSVKLHIRKLSVQTTARVFPFCKDSDINICRFAEFSAKKFRKSGRVLNYRHIYTRKSKIRVYMSPMKQRRKIRNGTGRFCLKIK